MDLSDSAIFRGEVPASEVDLRAASVDLEDSFYQLADDRITEDFDMVFDSPDERTRMQYADGIVIEVVPPRRIIV